ncbi:AT-rich interactive domain-containing protein 4B [Protopterus annectens]|uniref:AT-rich interactive domain-containing protein 4B n=1 Tax=Protopterus annectens TaxID=7888 RepID=UPI001CFBC787|nr:AT-rich interactive domain-containing protein 4B [Protopterus annectens]
MTFVIQCTYACHSKESSLEHYEEKENAVTTVFDDGDEKTLRRSSLCLKGERHFAESETLDQLPLTNPEHFGTPVIAKKPSRGRRTNNVPEEESLSSSSSDEGEDDQRLEDELLGKVVWVESAYTDRRACWYPGLVICSDCNDEIVVKRDSVLVRSFKDGKFTSVPRKDVALINNQMVPKTDKDTMQALDHAYEFVKNGSIPSVWKMELKEESSSSEEDETDEEDDDDKDKEESSDEEEVEPFPEEKENFLHQLYKFMEDRGTPINKRPVLGYMNLNLFKLYRLVHRLGGFDNIESGAVWKQVYQDLGIPVLNTAAGYNVKCAYRKYLYGFEEYCRSADIRFQMALPKKISLKHSKENTQQKECISEPSLENKSKILEVVEQVEEHKEYESEKKEHTRFSEEKKKIIHECASSVDLDKEKESKKGEMDFEDHTEEPKCQAEEMHQSTNTNIKEEPEQNEKSRDEGSKEEEDDQEAEDEEEFECYPPGVKVQVQYGRGKNQKLYEATIKESDLEGGEVLYLVHYCGWNVRYDEWIKADKIIRPVDKNVPKIKHRKKIKNKLNTEKELAEDEDESLSSADLQYLSRSLSQNLSDKSGTKLDVETKNLDPLAMKSTETAVMLNGIPEMMKNDAAQGKNFSECSSEDTEQEEDFTFQDTNSNANTEDLKDAVMHKDDVCDSQQTEEHLNLHVGNKDFDSVLSGTLKDSTTEFHQEQETLSEEDSDHEQLLGQRKKLQNDQLEKTQVKVSKRRCVHTQNWLKTSSSDRRTKRTKGKELYISMNSSSSEEEADGTNKGKFSSSRKYNGIDTKTKPVRTLGFFSAFSEIPNKRLKPHNSSEERMQNTRAKDRKDVWSSIKGQWPKKILKELFSDSDTETAASPPHESVEEVDATVQVEPVTEDKTPSATVTEVSLPVITDMKSSEDKALDISDKKNDFPSSGSNSLLNTPPATPESPSAQNVSEPCQNLPLVTVPPHALPTNQEDVQSIRSETDSTVEVDSVVGEMQDLQSEGNISPTGFDASVSSSSSNVPETEHKDKVPTCQKRFKDAQGGGLTKKLKQGHKCSGVLSRIKSVNSSDSEDLSSPESSVKSPQVKAVSLEINAHHQITKSPSRTQVSVKCAKNGEKNLDLKDSHLTKAHKWSFEMADLERMTAEERITFLQEKLQEIRQHYLSLKAEVASIDRRKKRLKKKERDRAAVTSSSSSSPSSSSLTAAVMLTLADSSVASSTQNGVSLECR